MLNQLPVLEDIIVRTIGFGIFFSGGVCISHGLFLKRSQTPCTPTK
jgi:hypothetical protein